jgi:hypothetical protein
VPFTFTDGDLRDRPNERPIDVQVTINTAHWIDRPIVFPGLRQPNPIGRSIGCVQSVADRTLTLGAAFCGDCVSRVVHYRWQYSIDGMNWNYADNGWSTTSLNFTAPLLFRDTYFRRLAMCDCTPTRINTTMPARITVAECPVNNAHVTAFVNVMYDFQSQMFETFFSGTVAPTHFRWQVSTDNTDWTDIELPGASGTTFTSAGTVHRVAWTLPANFIHNRAMPNPNAEGNLYFRTLMLTNGIITQLTTQTLQIHFIRTTQTGNNDFLPGFGMDEHNVRYAVLNRARQGGAASGNPNTIRVALLNVGATDQDGIGLGHFIQWGRRQDGHEQIVWNRNANTRAIGFTAVNLNITRAATDPQQRDADGQIMPDAPGYGRFITFGGNWTLESPLTSLWGNGANSRGGSPVNLDQWSERGRRNNPCPEGWRIPSRFEWWDMHLGSGTDSPPTTQNAALHSYGNHNNYWQWQPPQFPGTSATIAAGAFGGAVVRNNTPGENYGAQIFLPVAGTRTAQGGVYSISVLGGIAGGVFGGYWSSMSAGGQALWLTRDRVSSGGAVDGNSWGTNSFHAHGFSVRCVRSWVEKSLVKKIPC